MSAAVGADIAVHETHKVDEPLWFPLWRTLMVPIGFDPDRAAELWAEKASA